MIRVQPSQPRKPHRTRADHRRRAAREKACRHLLHMWRQQDAQWHRIVEQAGVLNEPLHITRVRRGVARAESDVSFVDFVDRLALAEGRARAEFMRDDVDWTPDGTVDPAFAATLQRLATRTDDAAVMAFHEGAPLATPREIVEAHDDLDGVL